MKKGLYLIIGSKQTVLTIITVFAVIIIGAAVKANNKVRSVASLSNKYPVIIIDAGHGGEDGGTQSASGILEKDINLSVSEKLENLLKNEGFRTVMTRSDDRMIYDDYCKSTKNKKTSDLHNRLEIMKEYPGCIFLSIHQNYFTESKYNGAQVFYRPHHKDSENLADCIQKSIVKAIQKDNKRQIKECQSNVFLICNAVSTAVMVECGFLSNEKEAQNLSDDEYQQKLSLAICEGLKNYLRTKEVNINGN